jgi:hypothetical protein
MTPNTGQGSPTQVVTFDSVSLSDVHGTMSNADVAVREAVESFVAQLKGLIQQAALESVQAALNGGGPVRRGATPRHTANGRPSGRRTKRTAAELDGMSKKLHSYVAKHPGQRIEQIGAALSIATRELALPVKKLSSEKKLTTKGQKRATTYFAK